MIVTILAPSGTLLDAFLAVAPVRTRALSVAPWVFYSELSFCMEEASRRAWKSGGRGREEAWECSKNAIPGPLAFF